MKSDDEIFIFEKLFIIKSILKHLNKEINVLLYSARKDGDDNNNFHKKVDKNKDLLYLIKTTNDVVFAIYIGNSRTDSLQIVISPANNYAIKSLNNNATYHRKSDIGAKIHFM